MLTRQSLQTIYQRKTQIRQKTRPVHTELGEGMHCHNGYEVTYFQLQNHNPKGSKHLPSLSD